MTDRAKKISELNVATSASGNDLLVVVQNVSGSYTTKSITASNLFGNCSANVVIYNATPANSTITVKKGTIMFDSNYIYVAVANNVLKRANLVPF